MSQRLCEGPPPHLRIRRDGYRPARPLKVLARLLIGTHRVQWRCPDGDIMADGTVRPREPQPVKS